MHKIWTCERCGTEDVLQEYYIYRPMNSHTPMADDYCQAGDSYWCGECDEECSPISSEINPLHEDYKAK